MYQLEPEIEISMAQFLREEEQHLTFLDEMELWAMEEDFNEYLFERRQKDERN